jgi:3',5'-cyclic AMP phosphodiesterase CpdA
MKILLAADLHFGSVPEGLAQDLAEAIEQEAPDVTVIAGDLTLAARHAEFERAGRWLRSLPPPVLVIPGNHDMPYWNLIKRFAYPFHRYKAAAGAETLMPVVRQGGGVVLGFNTTVSWQPHLRWQEGVARLRDILAAKDFLSSVPASDFKAVAAHHPFLKLPEMPRARPVRRASLAIRAFAESGVDLIMSGHTHLSFAVQREFEGQKIVAVGAPTALSTRMRGEANGFWIVEAEGGEIRCSLRLRRERRFEEATRKVFLTS